jgi:integrase
MATGASTRTTNADCGQCNQLHPPAPSADMLSYYLAASQSEATQKAYSSDRADFIAAGGKIPATPADIARYLASSGHLAISTLKRRLASLADAHTSSGHLDPTKHPLVKKVVRGMARVHGSSLSAASPLLGHDLARMIGALPDDLRGDRDRALLLVGFACALRRSELVSLRVEDLELTGNTCTIFLTKSKTDQFCQGRHLPLPSFAGPLSPVSALERWLAVGGIQKGPVFRSINRWGHVASQQISGAAVGAVVRLRATQAGISERRISAHSLRSGFVVSALEADISLPAVRGVTRHATLQGVAAYSQRVRPASVVDLSAFGSVAD